MLNLECLFPRGQVSHHDEFAVYVYVKQASLASKTTQTFPYSEFLTCSKSTFFYSSKGSSAVMNCQKNWPWKVTVSRSNKLGQTFQEKSNIFICTSLQCCLVMITFVFLHSSPKKSAHENHPIFLRSPRSGSVTQGHRENRAKSMCTSFGEECTFLSNVNKPRLCYSESIQNTYWNRKHPPWTKRDIWGICM